MGLLAPNGHIPRNYFLSYGIKLVLGSLFYMWEFVTRKRPSWNVAGATADSGSTR
jgi:hypothetical protein